MGADVNVKSRARDAELAHQSSAGHRNFEHVLTTGSALPIESICADCGWTWDWDAMVMLPGDHGSIENEIKFMDADAAREEAEAIASIKRAARGDRPERPRQARKSRVRPVRPR